MNKSITVIFVLLGAIGLHSTSAVPKHQKRDSELLNSLPNIGGSIWNTLVNRKLEVSLLAISRDDLQQEQQIHLSLANYESTNGLNSILKKEIVFITHGFISDGDEPWMKDLAQAYLDRKNVTIFIVDWGTGAKTLSYSEAVENSKRVAKMLTEFIIYLIKRHEVAPFGIHLIGYSLGAHLFGFVGKAIPGINRITGLDPAEKNFENDSKLRLSKNDAEFVDVVHSNTVEDGYGLRDSVGDVDFYLNGGETQPGCTSLFKCLDLLFKYPCSHYRSVECFIESIKSTNCVFVGSNKNNNSLSPFAELGLDTFNSQNVGGDYNIETNSQKPYCKNRQGL